jgi:T5SS/PEP-CTERM-associated repeat protein
MNQKNFFRILLPLWMLCGILTAAVNAQDLYVSSGTTTNLLSGAFSYSSTYVGFGSSDSNNILNVANSGTLLTNSVDLYVGWQGGDNSMVISSGAVVANSNGYIGFSQSPYPPDTCSNNNVVVTDSGTTWSNSGRLLVGSGPLSGGNSLVVSNGGVVYGGVTSDPAGVIVGAYASNNSVTVDGSGSRLFVTGGMVVGFGGGQFADSNSLTISDGGQVISQDNGAFTVGFSQSSNNSVLVTGAGSLLSFTYITVGDNYNGSGSLTVSAGASLAATNIYISYQSPGTLNVGALNGSDTAGTITASQIAVGYLSTNGSLNFNQIDNHITL